MARTIRYAYFNREEAIAAIKHGDWLIALEQGLPIN